MNNNILSPKQRNLSHQSEMISIAALDQYNQNDSASIGVANLQVQQSELFPQSEGKSKEIKSPQACRIHPEQKATYFLTTQPWVKLCKQCALNKALCGHQIQKSLTQGEFQKKITLTMLIEEIKNTITASETQAEYLQNIRQDLTGYYQNNIAFSIQQIDELMKELNKARQCLYLIYQKNVSKNVSQLNQKQQELKNYTIELKKQLEHLESSYCDLISDSEDGSEQFQRVIDLINSEIQRAKKCTILSNYKKQMMSVKNKMIEEFTLKFVEIGKKKSILEEISHKYYKKQSFFTFKTKRQTKSRNETYSSDKEIFTSRKEIKCGLMRKNLGTQNDENSQPDNHRQPNLSIKSQQKNSTNSSSKTSIHKRRANILKQYTSSVFQNMRHDFNNCYV